MGYRCALRNVGTLVGALLLLAAITAGPVLAQVGLPPSYDAQRIDPPNPRVGGGFGSGAASAGDVNGDGKDDILAYQVVGSPGEDGEVYVISGETGEVIDTIAAPDPGGEGNNANFAFPWLSKLGTNQGSSSADFTDLASCPGAGMTASPDKPLCQGDVGPPDGIPEILVGARGVDAKGKTDAGRAYVFDGRTRALLKRIDMPAADVTDVTLGTGVRRGGTWFGRSVLNPAGQPGCAGNSSVGPCQSVSREVQIGDMDGEGRPDIIIGASATTENPATAHPESECAGAAADANCIAAGRAYIYRGEEIVGSSPEEILDGTTDGDTTDGSNGTETVERLKNLYAQSSGGSQLFANSLSAIGDVGSCDLAAAPGIGPGDPCPEAASTTEPDGTPDVVAGAHQVDLPFDMPGGDLMAAGASLLVDGATGTVLRTYEPPEPQNRAVFGSQFQQPAPGDLGDTALPDAYIPAGAQDTESPTGGRGYVLTGNFKEPDPLISPIIDPTPNAGENFGGQSVGVGDLVGGAENPRNELLVGSGGPFSIDPGFPPPPPPNDLHFFNAATGRVLQTIADPDNRPGGAFGSAVMALGDLNGDGFLDFAVGAEQFSPPGGDGEGRLYIFESQAPAPPTPPTPPTPPGAGPCGTPGAAGYLNPAKMRVSRARVLREDRRLDVLAPITTRARGAGVAVTYQGDGRSDTFDAEVTDSDAMLDHVRFREPITRGQAELGTGIVNLHYLGDEDTREELVRLRAASQRAELDVEEISLVGDRLSAAGSVTSRAEGIVRLLYSYVDPDGSPQVHDARAEIQDDGDWELEDDQVPAQLARCGGYLSIQFTGYFERRIRGEQLAYELNAGQTRRP